MAKSGPAILAIIFLLLKAPKRESYVKARALVGDRDEGAFGRQHNFDADRGGRISGVAVLVGIAKGVPQRDEQVLDELLPRHRGKPFRERVLEQREKVFLVTSVGAHMGIRGRDTRVGEIAQRFADHSRRANLRQQLRARAV